VTPEQHRRARDLFEAALDVESSGLRGWLESHAALDPEVRAEVESLLEHHHKAGSFLTQPVAEAAPHLLHEDRLLEPGTVIGSYTVVRELGRGGMGRVYLANDARLGRAVALKVLAPDLTRDPLHRERLRKEARAAAALTHPGICTVYAFEEFDGQAYIVTEFVEGHTLREEIRGRRPPADDVIDTGHQLASALASAHEKGVTHRDLKPENVMRTRAGRVKVLDFGLARIEGDGAGNVTLLAATVPAAIAGTPGYMAPEQIEGKPVGPATDVFAFGVLMYEWITGVHPFQASSTLATLAKVVESTPTSLVEHANAPRFVAEIVDRCLRKSPADRYSSAVEICDVFEHAGNAVRYGTASSNWWRVHQLTAMALYIVATARAWQIKEWLRSPVSLWAFVFMGVAASVGGIVRGHLVFTDVMNRGHLAAEIRRTRRAVVLADVMMAATLLADALLLASVQPLAAVLTICVAVGIALAALLMEPATTSAVFGDI